MGMDPSLKLSLIKDEEGEEKADEKEPGEHVTLSPKTPAPPPSSSKQAHAGGSTGSQQYCAAHENPYYTLMAFLSPLVATNMLLHLQDHMPNVTITQVALEPSQGKIVLSGFGLAYYVTKVVHSPPSTHPIHKPVHRGTHTSAPSPPPHLPCPVQEESYRGVSHIEE